MSIENRLSIEISPEQLQSALSAANAVLTEIETLTIALNPSDRQRMIKSGNRSLPFINDSLNYCETNPEFAPKYLAVPEMKKDVQAGADLKQIRNVIEQILQRLDDTIMLAGSEAYIAALSYYHAVKRAAKDKAPGAEPIFEDLKQRF